MIKLDYSIQSPEERNALVQQILAETPNPSPKYLEILADYLVLCLERQEKRQKKLLTENRLATVSKRETSFEGLVSQFENGEDGIYGLITNDKNTIFQPRISITKKDLEEIPYLAQLRSAITAWESRLRVSEGAAAFTIKKALIEMRKDQYLIKTAYRRPIQSTKLVQSKSYIHLEDKTILFDDEGHPIPEGISLMDPKVCQAILSNYSRLKQDSWGEYDKDLWYLMEDFDKAATTALTNYPMYERIVELKIDGLQNKEIQMIVQTEFGIHYTPEYISSLWRKKIPCLIAAAAEDSYLSWYYLNIAPGTYKKCSKCGSIKLAHPKYFSRNKTSKDKYYSICKCCRNKVPGQKPLKSL